MRHFTQEEWADYISDQTPEAERPIYEEHLYACDACLNVYMRAVDLSLAKHPQPSKKSEASLWYLRPVFLYAAAASITILLMSSGVFDKITSQVDRFESQSSPNASSFSDKLMHKTVTMLDNIQQKDKGGTRIEP